MRRITFTTAALVLMVLAGCSQDKKPSPNELAKQQWNATRATVLGGLAKQQFESGNCDAARKSLDDAMALDAKNAMLHSLSAKIAIEQGRLELADLELKTARELDPNNAETDYLSGVVCQRWQKTQVACEYYTAACEKAPNELAYLLAKAEMLVALERRDEALATLQEKVVFFENSAAIRDAVGQLLVQQGRFEQAVPMLRQATLLAPEELALREHLALAMYRAKQYRAAGQVLQRLLADPKCAARADLWMAAGECQLQDNQIEEARNSFHRATQLDPSAPGNWLGLAKAALRLNDLPRAEASIQKAVALDGHSTEAHLLLGYLRLRQQKLPESLSEFRKASALDNADIVSLCMTGYVLEKLGKPSDAMACYAQALRLKPNDELASKLMAQVEVKE